MYDSLRFIFVHIILLLSMLLSGNAACASNAISKAHSGKFWIGDTGPTGPLFTGPHQYPFICFTFENGLGQPQVDNHKGIGNAVFPEVNGLPDVTADPVGYSEHCSIRTRVDYVYYSQLAGDFLPLTNPQNVPPDVATLTINDKEINFVVRLERGTINRFIYSIAMLAPFAESLEKPDKLNNSAWNKKLVYKFQGGVGIGHWQGDFSLNKSHALHYESLKRGYAVAYSTGTKTATQYNLKLAEETALMVKRHFQATYGKPKYTVGIGRSGGAIQQYVIGQNNRHIIDAAIPGFSYPDMVTQITHIADCEPMERYFDQKYVLDNTSRWGNWEERSLIEGLVTSNIARQKPWSLLNIFAPFPGSSECVNGWRNSIPLTMNPAWAPQENFEALALYRYPAEVIANIKWTHWNDLGNIYPQNEQGFAPNTWDNVGVQYGLDALLKGDISKQEFLEINACMGGWKQPQDMVTGNFPWDPDANPASLDPWNQINMKLNPLCKFGMPAPRTEGNIAAMNAAYQSGHVFSGKLKIPVIDIRWYLEPILDMHHTVGSFSARARMVKARGHADNQVIWVYECGDLDPVNLDEACLSDPIGKALDTIDLWLGNIKAKPADRVVGNKPGDAVDGCFFADGRPVYTGDNAWDGVLDDSPAGICSKHFKVYPTSRMVAGGNVSDDVFKCDLKPLATALSDGTYADVTFQPDEMANLNAIFPTGVCDYSKPGLGKPSDKNKKVYR